MIKGVDRRASIEEVDAEGSWAISYGDMVTLLLCFFILFFSVDPKRDRAESIQAALVKILSKAEAEAKFSGEGVSPTAKINTNELTKLGVSEDWGGKVHKVGNRILVEFPGVTFFGTAQVDLSQAGKKNLEQFIKMYLPYAGSNILNINAFADPRKVKNAKNARFRDNLELSALRGVAAMRVLQDAGLPLNRMRVAGFGEMKTTSRELASYPEKDEPKREKRAMDLARKVILVVQPEERGGQ